MTEKLKGLICIASWQTVCSSLTDFLGIHFFIRVRSYGR